MADGNRTPVYHPENPNIPLLPADAIMAALQAAAENTRPEGAFPNYDADDVQVNGAGNIPLPPDGILAAIQEAMADAAPLGMPDAPPPSPSPMRFEIRQVELVFNGSVGQSVTFKLKNTTKLRKAMDAYSARFQQPIEQLRFFFDGQRLSPEDTPAANEMVDGDIIEVHMEQLGGGSHDGGSHDGGSHDGGSDEEDWEDWVLVPDENILQRTIDEKARLCALIERLRREIFALKHNNRQLARENSSLKVDKKDVEDEYDELNERFANLMIEYQGNMILNDREIRDLKSSLAQKESSIDAILKDFQFTLN